MGVPQIKTALHDYINHADERFLKIVHAIMIEYKKDDQVVGSDPVKGVITKKQLVARAKASNLSIEKGRLKSIKQVRKEFKNWK